MASHTTAVGFQWPECRRNRIAWYSSYRASQITLGSRNPRTFHPHSIFRVSKIRKRLTAKDTAKDVETRRDRKRKASLRALGEPLRTLRLKAFVVGPRGVVGVS